jgi:hypothetical protein
MNIWMRCWLFVYRGLVSVLSSQMNSPHTNSPRDTPERNGGGDRIARERFTFSNSHHAEPSASSAVQQLQSSPAASRIPRIASPASTSDLYVSSNSVEPHNAEGCQRQIFEY